MIHFLDSEIDIFELDISLNWFTRIIQKTSFEKKLNLFIINRLIVLRNLCYNYTK